MHSQAAVTVEQLKTELQNFYNLTTWLLSVAPTGVLELGASQEYHDAFVKLAEFRRELREKGLVKHDERFWQMHLKDPKK